jgi:hypothetical protein
MASPAMSTTPAAVAAKCSVENFLRWMLQARVGARAGAATAVHAAFSSTWSKIGCKGHEQRPLHSENVVNSYQLVSSQV